MTQQSPPDTPKSPKAKWGVYFLIGDNIFDVVTLRRHYKTLGAPLAGLLIGTKGGGSFYQAGNWLIGADGSGGDSTEARADKTYENSGGEGFFSIGYLLLRRWLRVYPLVGIGGGGFSMDIKSSTGALEQEDAVDIGGAMLLVGIGFELWLTRRWFIGFRFGQVFPLMMEGEPRSGPLVYWRGLMGRGNRG